MVTGYAVLLSHSATQFADFARRSVELVALIVSWLVYRKIQRDSSLQPAEKQGLERTANLFVGGAMSCSGVVLLAVAFLRSTSYTPAGNVLPGLVIAILGLLTNGWFWMRYRSSNRSQPDAVIAGQETLYRAKTTVDLCVTIALLAVAVAPADRVTPYIDAVGSVIVAVYLLWNGVKLVRRYLPRVAAAGPSEEDWVG